MQQLSRPIDVGDEPPETGRESAERINPFSTGAPRVATRRRFDRRSFSYDSSMVRTIPRLRVTLALTALAVTIIDPTEPAARVTATYAALVLYVVYSGAFALWQRYADRSRFRSWSKAHWIDVAWITIFLMLSGGSNSIFFFLYLFAILTASFEHGYARGMAVTTVSVSAFVVLGSTPFTPTVQVNWFLLRAASLIVFGHMIATWGESEISLRKRLLLLKDSGVIANPRFGTDHVLRAGLEGLSTLYDRARCVLVTAHTVTDECVMRQATNTGGNPVRIEPVLAKVLLQLPATAVVVRAPGLFSRWARRDNFDSVTGEPLAVDDSLVDRVMTLLEARSLVSVPMCYDATTVGRLYLASSRLGALTVLDANFLLQVVDQLTLALENIQLVDTLASASAEQERHRIAHDIHDTVVQPYVGLHLALTAIHRSLANGQTNVLDGIGRLMTLAEAEMSRVRTYAMGLTTSRVSDESSLVSAIHRFAATLATSSGITVDVRSTGRLSLPDRVAAEIFQMIVEALSNVRRHTRAESARVEIVRGSNGVMVRVANRADAPGVVFVPRTITERAHALGGEVSVSEKAGDTVVTVEIPA